MINTRELKGLIAKNEISQAKVAEKLGITPKTFYKKMQKRKFDSDEMERMIDLLHIENPSEIFFDKNVT